MITVFVGKGKKEFVVDEALIYHSPVLAKKLCRPNKGSGGTIRLPYDNPEDVGRIFNYFYTGKWARAPKRRFQVLFRLPGHVLSVTGSTRLPYSSMLT